MAHPMSITIKDFQARVDAYAEDCSDALSDIKNLKFGAGRLMSFTSGEDNLFGAQASMLGQLNDWAFGQIVGRLDGPSVRWLGDPEHCPDTEAAKILNDLVEIRDNDRLLIRSKGQTVRAVLSDQYTKFDNNQMVDMVADAISTMGVDPEVHRVEVGDEMRAYILIPQIRFAEDPTKVIVPPQENGQLPGTFETFSPTSQYGDGGLHPAIYIGNSERGGGKARITGAVYRYVCGNGLIWGWNSQDIFAVNHRWISEGAMRTLVAEAMSVSFKMSETAARTFMASQEKHLAPKSLKPLIEEWASKYGLQIEAKDNWLAVATSEATSYGRTQDPRLFDVVNAATYVAQQRTPDEREVMERMAGDMLVAVR